MRARFLLTTALCSIAVLQPKPVQGEPITALISLLATPSLGALSIGGISLAAGTIGGALLSLGTSVALSAIAQKLQRRKLQGAQQDIKRQLAQPQSLPPKRFVYGRARVFGTPAPMRVKGNFLYLCLILNSRPSAGNVTVYFDGRRAQVASGDMMNFAGGGAILEPVETEQSFGAGDDRPKVWLGLGDQVGPPAEILADLPDELLATDGWRGLTVMWVKIGAGPSESRIDTWPRTPPEIAIEGDWSLVWNPRDTDQIQNDPTTWAYSNNQALCALDAILQNPIRRWPLFLVNLQSFIDGANLADMPVPLYHASVAAGVWPDSPLTVPTYTANGILAWAGGEIMDQVQPLADAGAGEIVKFGGQVTYSSGAARSSVYTITDILSEGGIDFERLRPGSDLPLAIKAVYVAPDREWQEAELPPLAIGAGGIGTVEDGITDLPLPFVTEPTQAMRVLKIVRNRIAAQKRLKVMLPPDAIQLIPGSVCTWDIPELPKCAGLWRVQEINPSLWLDGGGEVAMRCPVSLVEEPADVDAWNPAVDEFDLAREDYTPAPAVRVPPADLSATTGAAVASGDVPRIRFSFVPVAGNVVGYEWQWRATGDEYAEGGTISVSVLDTLGRGFGFLVPVVPGTEYQIRVRTIYLGGVSDFATVTITAQGPDFELDPPSDGSAIGGAGLIEVSFLTPNNTALQSIEFWGSDTDDITAAVLLTTIASAANTVRTITETDLGNDVTRFYFARARGPFESVSAFSSSVTATTDP